MINEPGAWALIDRGKYLEDTCLKVGRDPENLALKIFFKEPIKLNQSLQTYEWGGGWGFPIYDCTRMQNIAWYYGLAPRVYSLGVIDYEGKSCVCQLTDYLEGEEGGGDFQNIVNVLTRFGVKVKDFPDYKPRQFINGKLFDFQILGVDDKKYRDAIIEILRNRVFGFLYQSVPEIGLNAHRDVVGRIEDFELDKIDFRGKTVLDIGCSNGMFCNYAANRGAKRVVGLELPDVALAAFHLSNYLGNFNIDYIGCDLKQESYNSLRQKIGIDLFDYVFAFSITVHIGTPDFIHQFSDGILFFERSGGDIGQANEEGLKRMFHLAGTSEKLKNTRDQDREAYRFYR